MSSNARTGDLAVLGARPAFAEPLHVGRPNQGDRARLLARIHEMLDRNWLTNNGPFVQQFERRIAEIAGVKHCIAMCNATLALEITTRALGLRGEVIVPAMTFIATAHALQWQEITPVFCDIHPSTCNIDPARVEEMITPRTTGIIGVHLWGRACDVEALAEIAERRRLTLLFDAAHALGCTHRGRPVGGFGAAEIFSFHATKFVNSFEGGAVTTNDSELARKIRLMKNFGFQGYDNVVYIGTNGKMTEICAAMGLTSLEHIEEFREANCRNYRAYRGGLQGIPGLEIIDYDDAEKHNYQYIVVQIDAGQTGLTRDDLVTVLHAEKVLARRYFYPGCHRMEPYRSYFPHAGMLLPATEQFAQRVLLLPTGTSIGCEEVTTICDLLRTAVARASCVRAALNRRAGKGSLHV